MTKPQILNIDWPSIEVWLREIASRQRFDTIVGVARAGLPLAVGLSFLRPDALLAILSRRGPRGEKLPRYDFERDRDARIDELFESFDLSFMPDTASEILVIDDVVTSGDTMHMAAKKVLARVPDARISFASYAADDARLRSTRPEIFEHLFRRIEIDNFRTWVSFPWNLEP